MIVTTSKNTLLDNRGREIKLDQCLVDSFATPRGGWSVSFTINFNRVTIKANNARNVFTRSKKILHHNGIELSDKNIWLSLNAQWLTRVDDKDFLVSKKEFNKIIGSEEEDYTHEDYHHPSTWGSVEWNSLAFYLNVDPEYYSYETFISRCSVVLTLLDPSKSSRVGCVDCYKEFSALLDDLKTNPLYKLEEARKWLFNAHNLVNKKIGKKVIDFKTAKRLNKWN